MCAVGGTSEHFNIEVGVHQGTTLRPLQFVMVLEEVSKQFRRCDVRETLYADDLLLTGE